MHRDSERHKLFTRRAIMLGSGQAFLFSVLAGRMYYLQVIESDRYKTLADENRINLRLLPPPRGQIVDRFGKPMAVNRQNYQVLLVPEQAADIPATLEKLSLISSVSSKDRSRVLREIGRKRAFVPITVSQNLEWDDVARIEVNTPDLPGIMIDVGQTRDYLHGDAFAHVLGYVAPVTEDDMGGDPLLQLPGFRVGKAGIEKVHDQILRGTGGNSQVEVNALGRVIRELSREEGVPGAEVVLNIDMDLQNSIVERLKGQSAAAVVLDVHTGDVLAMVSTPGFDPNMFNRGLSSEEWQDLVSNPMAPLTNKAISGQYPPGSAFKMLVALAALEKNAITPETRVHCSGSTKLGNAEFHCWKRGGHGYMNMNDAISQSCDVYFYDIARRIGIDRIAVMAKRFGLGGTLGLDLPGERGGLMPDKAWKREALGGTWQHGETLIAGIGQGYVLTTPLQLAVMTARIANGGLAVTPKILRSVIDEDGVSPQKQETFSDMGINPQHMKLIQNAMVSVVNDTTGTAFNSRIHDREMAMAGKTGTAQVRRISTAERETGVRKNNELPWKERDHAIFVGYAPIKSPRYAVSVVVEHGGGGSSVAAPIAKDILLEAQRRNSARAEPPQNTQENTQETKRERNKKTSAKERKV